MSRETGTPAADPVASILEALRRVIDAERESRRRTGHAIGVNEADLVAIRALLEAQDDGIRMSATDLARAIGISSASTTALIDRLETGGLVRRSAHPSDRRIVIVEPTVDDDSDVLRALGGSQRGMADVATRFSAAEAAVVARFFAALSEMYDGIHPDPEPA